MTGLYLENETGFTNVRLWNGQQFGRSVDANTEIFAPAVVSDTVISALSSEGQLSLEGTTVGQQRIDEGVAGTSDPTEAVAEWAAEIEAYVNDDPANAGFTLRNDHTGERENVTPEAIAWSRGAGEYQSVEWSLDLRLGGETAGDLGISPRSVSPGGTDTYDGVELPGVFERRVDKSVNLNTVAEIYSESSSENQQIQTQGAVKRITLLGAVEKSFSELRTFDEEFSSRAGDGQTYTFSSAFPGGSFEAAIGSYESTREAGVTRRGEYVLELIAGSVI